MSRLKMAMAGEVELTVRIPKPAIAFIDAWATARGESRTRVIQDLLKQGVARAREAFDEAQKLLDHGVSHDGVDDYLRLTLGVPQSAGDSRENPTGKEPSHS
jgi:hypothetical protein